MINLYDILEAADGQLFGEPVAQIFSDFSFDAQTVKEGELYVAIKTEHGDGHHTMADAVAAGATGIMCTHPPTFDTDGLTVVVMRSVEDALIRWTEIVLQKYGTTVIGVTGSVGKSTTQAAIAQVLGTQYNVYRRPITLNGRFGLPLALGGLNKDHQIAVLEFNTDQFGEMAEMVSVSAPMVGVVTGISHALTERLGTLENIANEKAELIRSLPREGLAVLNFDDPLTREMAGETAASVLTVGLDIAEPAFGADLMAYNILVDCYKTGFDLRHGQSRFAGRWVPLLGAHQLYGVLSALAIGLSYGVSLEDGLQALTEMEPLPGRMCPLGGPNGSLLIDDSFGSTPEGTLAALEWLKAARNKNGKLIFVMGDMGALGNYSPLAHMEVGQRAADIVDRFITTGDMAAEAGRAALEAGMPRQNVHVTFNAADAATMGRADLSPNDIVLIEGSTAARMERIVRRLLDDPADAVYLARQDSAAPVRVIQHPGRPTWLEINMEAIAYNVRRLKEIVGPDVTLMAVVKANAYGHGAIPVSSTALNNGAGYLGVGSIEEAIELREGGIEAPILVMGYTAPQSARDVIRYGITVTLYDIEVARAFNRTALEMDTIINAHVKIDTGMGRLGLESEDVTTFFRSLYNMSNLTIEGLFTHFSSAGDNVAYTRKQIATFEATVDPLLAAGFRYRYIHAANSAAAIHLEESRFNMVRTGLAIYGLSPSPFAPVPADFRPALQWKTTIAQVKRLPPGSYIGYGNTYRTQNTQRIAIIPVGYADGFRLAPRRWKHVLVKGEYAPLVGRVSMDMTAIDVSTIDDVQIGDEVVLIGRQGSRSISADDVAEYLDTINYEVITTISPRVPRIK
ncbi:MAG: alanine racemase [Anaerolineae bacterium]|nr:alanine racemase [Anaerolineae bacterium]